MRLVAKLVPQHVQTLIVFPVGHTGARQVNNNVNIILDYIDHNRRHDENLFIPAALFGSQLLLLGNQAKILL